MRRLGLGIGDAVLVHGGWGCGDCRECAAGEEQRCPSGRSPGFQADGGYAELDAGAAPAAPRGVRRPGPGRGGAAGRCRGSPRTARSGGRAVAGAGARVLVIGCGELGQFALQYLRLAPAGATSSSRSRELAPAELERATELGADVGAPRPDDDADDREALGGHADVVLDFVGTDETLALAAAGRAGRPRRAGRRGRRAPRGWLRRPAVEAWVTTVAWGSMDDLREVVRLAEEGRLRWDVEAMDLEDARPRMRGFARER